MKNLPLKSIGRESKASRNVRVPTDTGKIIQILECDSMTDDKRVIVLVGTNKLVYGLYDFVTHSCSFNVIETVF